METRGPPAILTAAECAARTGLTQRALRLYEEQGLITPRRSAGGWRVYGAEDLARLNTITLLKSAGLTLAQIASVTGSGAQQPTLERIVTIQLQSLKARRADAERGQRIAEAALERLHRGEALTVDDFCDLIRSLEMIQPDPTTSPPGEPDAGIDESLLERYAGLYQVGDWNIIKVRRDGKKLLLENSGTVLSPQELRPTSECDFEMGEAGVTVTFDRAGDGQISGLRLRTKGGDMPAARVDQAVADQVQSRLAARIKDSTPLPGSEAAVRRLIEGLIDGQPPYEEMHPALAHVTQLQLPRLQAAAAYLGAIQSIDFQGVGSRGWDVYDIRHERGTSRVRIVLRSNGLMTGALFMVKEGPVSLGP